MNKTEQNYKMIYEVRTKASKQKVSTYEAVENYLISLPVDELEDIIKNYFIMSKGIHKRPKATYKERMAKSVSRFVCDGDCFLYY